MFAGQIFKANNFYRPAVVLTPSISAQAAPPSSQSVEKLLELSKAGKQMNSVFDQMDGMMKTSLKQLTKGKPPGAAEQAILDKQQAKMMVILKDEFSWAKMKAPFIQVYCETFSQEEVDGLIAFYQSPAGQAFVDKQPALMKNTMTIMQERMGPMMQKIQQMSEETAKELQVVRAKK